MASLPRRAPRSRAARSSAAIAPPKATQVRYIVIGGGIAGVCCAQEIARLKADDQNVEVVIITATELLREVGQWVDKTITRQI